jgi:hydroxymethylbilane synthase
MARADPRDVLVLKAGRPHCEMADLPAGVVVGTSSIRRTAQIALKHPHLRVLDVRGNVPTRLRKLDADDSPFDAIIVAAAGLLRLDLGHRITQYLDSSSGEMLYAVGQGAIGVEIRADDENISRILSKIEDTSATLACTAERSLLRTLEGGCSAPLGVETKWLQPDVLQMKAIVVSIDGSESVESEMQARLQTAAEAEQFGETVAAELLRKGADRILAAIQAKKMTRPADLEEK